jgi:hypothetical protein
MNARLQDERPVQAGDIVYRIDQNIRCEGAETQEEASVASDVGQDCQPASMAPAIDPPINPQSESTTPSAVQQPESAPRRRGRPRKGTKPVSSMSNKRDGTMTARVVNPREEEPLSTVKVGRFNLRPRFCTNIKMGAPKNSALHAIACHGFLSCHSATESIEMICTPSGGV